VVRVHLGKITRVTDEEQRWTKVFTLWTKFYTVILGQTEVALQPLEKFDGAFNTRHQLLLAFRDCIVCPLAKRGRRSRLSLPSARDAASPIMRQMLFVLLHNGAATSAAVDKHQSTLSAFVLHCFPSTAGVLQRSLDDLDGSQDDSSSDDALDTAEMQRKKSQTVFTTSPAASMRRPSKLVHSQTTSLEFGKVYMFK